MTKLELILYLQRLTITCNSITDLCIKLGEDEVDERADIKIREDKMRSLEYNYKGDGE